MLTKFDGANYRLRFRDDIVVFFKGDCCSTCGAPHEEVVDGEKIRYASSHWGDCYDCWHDEVGTDEEGDKITRSDAYHRLVVHHGGVGRDFVFLSPEQVHVEPNPAPRRPWYENQAERVKARRNRRKFYFVVQKVFGHELNARVQYWGPGSRHHPEDAEYEEECVTDRYSLFSLLLKSEKLKDYGVVPGLHGTYEGAKEAFYRTRRRQ